VSGFVNDLIRTLVRHPRIDLARDMARDPRHAPAVDLGLDLPEDDNSQDR